MKASVRWLRELCSSLPDDVNLLAQRLTAAGLEVEAVDSFGLASDSCVVASVVAARPHPTRSSLHLVTVDPGGAHVEVICGAPNVPPPGGLVVFAPVGTHLPAKGVTIETRVIAGVASSGMLCSEAELGLGDDADGILVLPAGATPGTRLASALPGSRDAILEIGLTPNRADGLGHLGLAREAAALFEIPFSAPVIAPPKRARGSDPAIQVAVTIADPDRCPHYGAALVDKVGVAPSPPELRWRLAALGVRPISNVVDVTNLVMLEFGHPMHAFDLDKVRGARIEVRRASEGEKLVTLDGTERSFSSDDLVICDGAGPVALAGVIGGESSEIKHTTRRILLECAYFEPRGVRRAARRHGLHTESSHRFERGVDWSDTRAALDRALALVVELCGAEAVGAPYVVEARPLVRVRVPLRQERLEALTGVEIAPATAAAILQRLGFQRLSSHSAGETWEVPGHRPDVSREVDLIEEVARVRGYDAIEPQLPAVRPSRDMAPRDAFARNARGAAVSMGLSEAITFSFVASSDLERVGAPAPSVSLRNPLLEEQSVMRTSLLPGLLQTAAQARRHGERDTRLFSVGTLFGGGDAGSPEERLGFAALLTGARESWLGKGRPVDVWDAKGIAEGLVHRLLGRSASVRRPPRESIPRHLHPRGAAWIEVEGRRMGAFGPLHPDVAEAFGLGEEASVVELDLEQLSSLGRSAVRFVALPRFPASSRDLSVTVRDDVAAGELEEAVRHAAGELAEHVSLFDRFVGGAIPRGHASLGLRVVYRASDRTLTDEEVDARHAQVVGEIQRRFGAELRS